MENIWKDDGLTIQLDPDEAVHLWIFLNAVETQPLLAHWPTVGALRNGLDELNRMRDDREA